MTFTFCPHCTTALTTRVIGGEARSACPVVNCGFVHWDNPVPVVAAVVQRNDSVVLVRNVGWPENWFGLISGFLERGESPSEGVLREVKEETGLDGRVEGLIGVYPFHRMNQVIMVYHVVADEGEVVVDPKEIADYRIIELEKVRPWRAATGYALKDFLEKRGLHPDFV